MNVKKRKGFTFIETLTVVAIIGFALPTLFSIVYSVLRQQAKINSLLVTKAEGDEAFSIIQTLIRNRAVSVHNSSSVIDPSSVQCASKGSTYPATATSDGTTFYLKDKYDNWFQIYLTSDGTIASDSSILNASADLTSSKVKIDNFDIRCSGTTEFAAPVVSIRFRASYNTSSARPEDIASLNYQTKVKIRNTH